MTIKLTREYFAAGANLYGPAGLSAVLRCLARNNAAAVLKMSSVGTVTDSSTGTSSATPPQLPMPAAGPIDATSSGGSQAAALNASLGKSINGIQALANQVNLVRNMFGLVPITMTAGTVAMAGTVPAQDKASTPASGTAAADYQTSYAAFKVVAQDMLKVTRAMNDVFVAIGQYPMKVAGTPVSFGSDYAPVAAPTINAVAAGPGALAQADADAFLLAAANFLASMAGAWNTKVTANVGPSAVLAPLGVVAV